MLAIMKLQKDSVVQMATVILKEKKISASKNVCFLLSKYLHEVWVDHCPPSVRPWYTLLTNEGHHNDVFFPVAVILIYSPCWCISLYSCSYLERFQINNASTNGVKSLDGHLSPGRDWMGGHMGQNSILQLHSLAVARYRRLQQWYFVASFFFMTKESLNWCQWCEGQYASLTCFFLNIFTFLYDWKHQCRK